MTHEPRRTQWRQVAGPDLNQRSFGAAVVPDGPSGWEGGEYERIEAKNRALLVAHFARLVATPSGAPSILTPVTTKAAGVARGSTDRPDLAIPVDLSIPDFLRRR
jgi:hypothetical protein